MTAKDVLRALTPPILWSAARKVKIAIQPSPDRHEALAPIPQAEPEPSPPLFDGSHSKSWWKTRDTASQSSALPYWEQRTHPGRARIAKAIAALPGSSLLEIGVHAGPTMWAIAQQKHFDRLAGIELSPTILEFTRETLPAALAQNVELVEGSASSLPFEDKSFDIVVTCMVLSCIGPEEIEQSLDEMLRVCKGHIVLGEPFNDEDRYANAEGKLDPYPNTTYWIRNYAGMLAKSARVISCEHIPKEDQAGGHLNSVLVLQVL